MKKKIASITLATALIGATGAGLEYTQFQKRVEEITQITEQKDNSCISDNLELLNDNLINVSKNCLTKEQKKHLMIEEFKKTNLSEINENGVNVKILDKKRKGDLFEFTIEAKKNGKKVEISNPVQIRFAPHDEDFSADHNKELKEEVLNLIK